MSPSQCQVLLPTLPEVLRAELTLGRDLGTAPSVGRSVAATRCTSAPSRIAAERLAAAFRCSPDDFASGAVPLREYEERGNFVRAVVDHPLRGRIGFRGLLRPDGEAPPPKNVDGDLCLPPGVLVHLIERVEAELSRLRAVAGSPSAEPPKREGLTIAEFAHRLGVDHRRLSRHLVEIGTGPAPVLPPGKIPVRRIGTTRRILLDDFRGNPNAEGGRHDRVDHEASETARRQGWRGSLDSLRDP